jgi:hypothetical protein
LKGGSQRVQNDDKIVLPTEGVFKKTQNNYGMSDQPQKKLVQEKVGIFNALLLNGINFYQYLKIILLLHYLQKK